MVYVDPPGMLKTRVYVDLVGQDARSARAALLAARGARYKPVEAPEYPGDRRSKTSAIEAPRFPGELPSVWNVPFHPNPFFVGRDVLLDELQTRLTAPEMVTRRVALTGLGGIGKTSEGHASGARRQNALQRCMTCRSIYCASWKRPEKHADRDQPSPPS